MDKNEVEGVARVDAEYEVEAVARVEAMDRVEKEEGRVQKGEAEDLEEKIKAKRTRKMGKGENYAQVHIVPCNAPLDFRQWLYLHVANTDPVVSTSSSLYC